MLQITTHEAKTGESGSEQHRSRAAIWDAAPWRLTSKTGSDATVYRYVSRRIKAGGVKEQDVSS